MLATPMQKQNTQSAKIKGCAKLQFHGPTGSGRYPHQPELPAVADWSNSISRRLILDNHVEDRRADVSMVCMLIIDSVCCHANIVVSTFKCHVFDARLAARDGSLAFQGSVWRQQIIICHRRSGGAELDISRS